MFASGLKVLVKVSVEFHELYGYSLTVLDIDPAYTLGDMLKADGDYPPVERRGCIYIE